MAVHAVFLNEPDSGVWEILKKEWPNGRHLLLNDHMAFVAPEEVTLCADIAETLGITSEGEVAGLVFEWTSNAGYNSSTFWEWLRKVEA